MPAPSLPPFPGRFWISGANSLVPAGRDFSWFSLSRAGNLRFWCRHVEVSPLFVQRRQCPEPHCYTREGPQSRPVDRDRESVSQLSCCPRPPQLLGEGCLVWPPWEMGGQGGLDLVTASLHPRWQLPLLPRVPDPLVASHSCLGARKQVGGADTQQGARAP